MESCRRCGGQLIIEGDDLDCLQCGYNEPRVQNGEAEDKRKCANDKRGIRYAEDVKRQAVLYIIQGKDREKVRLWVGCEINTLKQWEKDYSAMLRAEEYSQRGAPTPTPGSEHLHRRKEGVVEKITRPQLPCPNKAKRYTKNVKIAAVKELEDGASKYAVSKRIGCSLYALDYWLKQYGHTPVQGPEPPDRVVPPRHPNGTLDFTEEERLAILEDCRKLGLKVTSKNTGINRSSLNRWKRCLRKTGYTLQSDNPQVSTCTDHIAALRELQNKLTAQWYDLGRQREAVNAAIDILIEQRKAEVVK